MSTAPIVRLGADVAPAGRAIAASAAGIVANLATTGAAAALAGRHIKDFGAGSISVGRQITGELVTPMRLLGTTALSTGRMVGQASVAVGSFAAAHPVGMLRAVGVVRALAFAWHGVAGAILAAGSAGAAEIASYARIAAQAREANVGTTFFQSMTEGADRFQIKARDIQADLVALARAAQDKFGEPSKLETEMSSRVLGADISRQPLDDFRSAQSREDRIRAALALAVELEDRLGRLAAIDFLRSAGAENFAKRLEEGNVSARQIVAEVERLRQSGIADGSIVSPELINRAQDLQRRFGDVTQELSQNLRPILEECARLMLSAGENTVWWYRQLAAIAGIAGGIVAKARELAGMANTTPVPRAGPGEAVEQMRRGLEEERRALAGIPEPRAGMPDALAAQREARRVRITQMEAELALTERLAAAEQDAEAPRESRRGRAFTRDPQNRVTGFDAPVPGERPDGAPARAARSSGSSASETDKWADAYAKLIQNMEKANAQVAAELATHGKSTEERQRALDIAKLEAEARRTGGTITAAQRSETERLATANARLSDSLKQAQADAKGLSDALQYGGDRLVDLVFNSRDLAGLWKGLMTEIGRSAITGQGPFAQLLGMAPAAGAPAGTLGGLMGLVQGARGAGGAAGGLGGLGGLSSLFKLLFGGGATAAGEPLNLLAYIQHAGGLVGSGPGRAVPASLFVNAQRRHGGGPLMRGGEVPVIAEMTEEILNKRQRGRTAEALAMAGSANGRMVTNVYQNIPAQVRTEQGDDGSLNIFLEAAESHMAGRISAGRGPVPAAIGGFTGAESNRNMNG